MSTRTGGVSRGGEGGSKDRKETYDMEGFLEEFVVEFISWAEKQGGRRDEGGGSS